MQIKSFYDVRYNPQKDEQDPDIIINYDNAGIFSTMRDAKKVLDSLDHTSHPYIVAIPTLLKELDDEEVIPPDTINEIIRHETEALAP